MSRESNDTKVTVSGTKLRETDKAVQFTVQSVNSDPLDPPKNEWFPFSQISKIGINPPDRAFEGTDFLIVSEWIMTAKGLL